MARDHEPSVKNDKQYEGLRDKGMSKQRAAKIANAPKSSDKKGGQKAARKAAKRRQRYGCGWSPVPSTLAVRSGRYSESPL